MKKQPTQATTSASASANNADSTKNKKQQAQTKSSESNSKDNKAKSSASNTTENKTKNPTSGGAAASALPPKSHFTAGAQGDSEHSYRILDTLISLFEQAMQKAFPDEQNLPVVVVPGKQTDYQCNSAMGIAKVHRTPIEKSNKIITGSVVDFV